MVLRQGSAGGLVACGVVLPPSTLTENVTQVCLVGLARCFADFLAILQGDKLADSKVGGYIYVMHDTS